MDRDENPHVNVSYYSGIPNTAPPSFQSVAPANLSEDAVSLWADSTVDLEAAREDTVVRLMMRVEELERRLDEGKEGGARAKNKDEKVEEYLRSQQWANWSTHDRCVYVGVTLGCTAFVVWLCATITLSLLRPRVVKG